ncbi:hypothetical protein CLW00_106191 [Mongoliibacter ruber]|uniref:Uncharacterized protein n=1 Tax=Mongoliibacter ruber TaxID=1750599 RepID=A0A2T0WLK9_9BACT|nr:hypothetical protein CLW00_106191 [Mongoliibacter ruber]
MPLLEGYLGKITFYGICNCRLGDCCGHPYDTGYYQESI